MVDRHYSLNLKPCSARTLYVFAQYMQIYCSSLLVCRKFFSPGCAPRKKILFSCPAVLKPISTQEKFPWTENFPKMSLLKVENFQLPNFFPTENLCRPITFYKIFFPRKIFLSGNGAYARQFYSLRGKHWPSMG